jgi:ubiquinone/menaquinone biosynthesis C-methylase UbiE
VAARPLLAALPDAQVDEVVEIGFGTGLNTEHYPEGVTKALAVEPSETCVRIAEPRIAASSAPVELAGLDGQRLELPSESVDAVLSTWTLCTIPDADTALAEIRRVLKPTGTFHFVEHGHSPDEKVARWQRRIEPVSKPVLGGCHATRDITNLLRRAGFTVDPLDNYYAEKEPKVFGDTYEGVARKA